MSEPSDTTPLSATVPNDGPDGPPSEGPAAIAVEWAVGDVFDVYEVTAVLGEGGMGRVYKVHHRGWDADLAVKSPRPDVFATAAGKEAFVREAETWVQLGLHPHVVTCYYVRTLGGVPRVFSEYVDGGSLSEWIRDGRLYEGGADIAMTRILDVAIQFAWGLAYAHDQELVHQDVKPANVMMTADGTAKVTDFGLAQGRARPDGAPGPVEPGRSVLVPGAGFMTREYCSPEQAAREPLTRATDVWSWAVSVLEMFTGGVTWVAGHVVREVLEAWDPASMDEAAAPSLTDSLRSLLLDCLARRPAERPAMSEVASRLRRLYPDVIGSPFPRREPVTAEIRADSLNNRALSLLDLGRGSDAEAAWEAALQSDPHHLESVHNRGLLKWRTARCTDDELVQDLEQVRASHGQSTLAEYLLGLVHLERSDPESAQRLLEAARQGGQDEKETRWALDLCHSRAMTPAREAFVFRGHRGEVTCVCLSADGTLALSAAGDSGFELLAWDARSGAGLLRLVGHEQAVRALAITRDGRMALSGGDDMTVRLWEIGSGTCLRTLSRHTNVVTAVAFDPSGRWAATGSKDGRVHVWDLATGECLASVRQPGGVSYWHRVRALALSSRGQRVLSAGCEGRASAKGWHGGGLRVWDTATGECLKTLMAPVYAATLGADDRTVHAACSSLESGPDVFETWDAVTGECLRSTLFPRQRTRREQEYSYSAAACISADGRWLLTGQNDPNLGDAVGHPLRLVDASGGRVVRTLRAHRGHVTSVSLSADGRRGASASADGTVRIWDLPGRAVEVCSWRMSQPHRTEAAAQSASRVKHLLEAAQKAIAERSFAVALDAVRAARSVRGYERAPDVMDAWNAVGRFCRKRELRAVWSRDGLSGAEGPWQMYLPGDVCCVTPDGAAVFASASGARGILKWDLTARGDPAVFSDQGGHQGLAISGDGQRLIGSGSPTILLSWRSVDGPPPGVWNVAGGAASTLAGEYGQCAALSADGRLALVGRDRQVCLHDAGNGRLIRVLHGHQGDVRGVEFAPDGRWAVSAAADGSVIIWDLADGHCLDTLAGHRGVVAAVSVSPDGRHLVSGSHDRTLRYWEVSTGRCVRVFEGHPAPIVGCRFSGDGQWVVSAAGADARNRTRTPAGESDVRIWSVASGRCVWASDNLSPRVTRIDLTRDARHVVVADEDGYAGLRVWEVDWDFEAALPADWDDGASPFLEAFLALRTRSAAASDRRPWGEPEFEALLDTLAWAGYGWLRPEGVRRALATRAARGEGSP